MRLSCSSFKTVVEYSLHRFRHYRTLPQCTFVKPVPQHTYQDSVSVVSIPIEPISCCVSFQHHRPDILLADNTFWRIPAILLIALVSPNRHYLPACPGHRQKCIQPFLEKGGSAAPTPRLRGVTVSVSVFFSIFFLVYIHSAAGAPNWVKQGWHFQRFPSGSGVRSPAMVNSSGTHFLSETKNFCREMWKDVNLIIFSTTAFCAYISTSSPILKEDPTERYE